MLDQAFQLRQAFRLPPAAPRGERPRLVALAGGCGGVGVTSMAVQLARALVWNGQSTLLVDGDFEHPHLPERLGVEPQHNLSEALAGRTTLHEALDRGPCGELLLAGDWGRRGAEAPSASAQVRLIDALRNLGGHVDAVLIDAGRQRSAVLARWAKAVDLLMIVVKPEPAVVLDTYALLKWLRTEAPSLPPLGLLAVCDDAPRGDAALDRMAQALRRFQRLELHRFGSVSARQLAFGTDAAAGSPTADVLAIVTAMGALARADEAGDPTQSSDPLQPIKSSSRVSST